MADETKEKLKNAAAVFASGYVKRWMEGNYDRLMTTESGQRLQALDDRVKYVLEAGAYALMAFADQHLSADTPLKRLIREISLDAAPELSKRMVNGVREKLSTSQPGAANHEVAQALLKLGDDDLGALLAWLSNLTPEKRAAMVKPLSSLSGDDLKRFATLSPHQRDLLSTLDDPMSRPRSQSEPARAGSARTEVTKALKGLRKRMRDKTGELRAKRRDRGR